MKLMGFVEWLLGYGFSYKDWNWMGRGDGVLLIVLVDGLRVIRA